MFNFSGNEITAIVSVIVAFGIIVTASGHLAKIFQKIHLPLITGFIIIGILAGPYLLKMLPGNLNRLEFINDISLAFIAFASGTEIYLKEIRDKVKDIGIMTAVQLVVIFTVSFIIIYIFSDYIPFTANAGKNTKIAISLLISTIFIASSPASAIAVINELRAKGRFTKISLGVTVIKDIFVIILFAGTFAVAEVLISGNNFNFSEILVVFADLFFSILIGLVYGKILELNFKIVKTEYLDIAVVLLLIKYSRSSCCDLESWVNCMERCLVDVWRKVEPWEISLSVMILVGILSMRMLSDPRKIPRISEMGLAEFSPIY
ncbi:MAG: cation:proton antiporter [Bacteroidales bacterium]|nr:cation:proton antiporter [Bacteroidales bacterium]